MIDNHFSRGKCIAAGSNERRVHVVRRYRKALRDAFYKKLNALTDDRLNAGCNLTDVIGERMHYEELRAEKGHFAAMEALS